MIVSKTECELLVSETFPTQEGSRTDAEETRTKPLLCFGQFFYVTAFNALNELETTERRITFPNP